ncbi:tetratricopeptide repeat protein [Bowmanella yangjiangensis]|uniref:Tetratricopeptide repeat protein n=1 Tax=Bowmanella yangjiangensis TaxID=2811230 RepID=A0ABS3CQW6_9ALTE|nr:tetratricopeptide repeat protein [Bowmanella yangjiangensis]MBN7819471.1 tetratricopeptide repeat protein [Bowmanella yangjiangensis]
MKLFRLILVFLFSAGMMACTNTPKSTAVYSPQSLLMDENFAGFEKFKVESEHEVFALDDEMMHFAEKVSAGAAEPKVAARQLVRAVFGRADLNLLYANDANTIARDTFHNRAANCLSMSIMTFALAEQAGMQIEFQEVDVPEFWTRRDGYSMLNGHVNLRISPKLSPNSIYFNPQTVEVDFDPQVASAKLPTRTVTKQRVLAMFYNNKAADALVNNDAKRAYAYSRASVLQDPSLAEAWVNLGVLYRQNGLLDEAERSYQRAIQLEGSRSAKENLAVIYNLTGREKQAALIMQELEQQRTNNPYYHFLLGEQEYELAHWRAAIGHYRRAIELNRQQHEFYFGLAKAYYEMGDLALTERYLKLAKRRSVNDHDEHRYQSKLNLLTKL